jgi:hypothetical protein
MNIAIMPLVQVAALPRLMMRTPKCLTLTLPRSMRIRHLVLSIRKSTARTDRVRWLQNKCAKDGRLRADEKIPCSSPKFPWSPNKIRCYFA